MIRQEDRAQANYRRTETLPLVPGSADPNAHPEVVTDDGVRKEVLSGTGVPGTREHPVAGSSRGKELITEIGKKQRTILDAFTIPAGGEKLCHYIDAAA